MSLLLLSKDWGYVLLSFVVVCCFEVSHECPIGILGKKKGHRVKTLGP